MKYAIPIVAMLLAHAVPMGAWAQRGNLINFNIDNGFPSNHIYDVVQDRLGYLWIATDKGVLRYNGYEFRQYTEADGLPTDDIWQIMEDKRGRLWLGAIADELGYLLNGKYHKAPVKAEDQTIYPHNLAPRDSGIIFSMANSEQSLYQTYFVEKSDSFSRYEMTEALFGEPLHIYISNNVQTFFNLSSESAHGIFSFTDECGRAYAIYNRNLYSIKIDGSGIKSQKILSLTGEDTLPEVVTRSERYFAGKYVIIYGANAGPGFHFMNMETGAKTYVHFDSFPNEHIVYLNLRYDLQCIYAITQHHLLQYDLRDPATCVSCRAINALIDVPENDEDKVRSVFENPFWGACIGTTANGVFINKHEDGHLKSAGGLSPLAGYDYVTTLMDSVSFWWNPSAHMLAGVGEHLQTRYYPLPGTQAVTGVFRLANDTFLLTGHDTYFFMPRTGKTFIVDAKRFGVGSYHTILENRQSSYSITNIGFYHVMNDSDSTSRRYIDRSRFNGLVYDSFRKNYWAYNKDRIHIYASGRADIECRDIPAAFGVTKPDNIVFDNKYGNIFLKGSSGIVLYDYEQKSWRELFRNFNLKESSIYVYHNTLIVAGRVGVIFCKILGRGMLGKEVVYRNFKSCRYNHVAACAAVDGQLVMKTDKGFYTVTIPADSALRAKDTLSESLPVRFVVNHNDTLTNIGQGDTVGLNPRKALLQFDVINPEGSGKLRFSCRFVTDSGWRQLNANELSLPPLTPDNYYKLSLAASDDIWRSEPIDIYIYIIPQWWQTQGWQKIIWLSAALLALLVLAIAILVTRRLVINANKKRNARMELELKSIYSQINPHFIFNSLGSALLLVRRNRMDEAYEHISKFSRLLRSYIKSSRNKLISIDDEVANLTDYIELQQTRFKNKFGYRIEVSGVPDGRQVKIPSLLLQPFVENAINHGLLPKEEPGMLLISISMVQKDLLTCTVDDDGIGRRRSRMINEQKEGRESYGDQLVKDLVSILNKYENMNVSIAYTDKEPPATGTTVTITIKNPYYDR